MKFILRGEVAILGNRVRVARNDDDGKDLGENRECVENKTKSRFPIARFIFLLNEISAIMYNVTPSRKK